MVMLPSCTSHWLRSKSIKVDLLALLGPTKATCLPSLISKENFSTTLAFRLHSASSEPYSKVTFLECSDDELVAVTVASGES
jgi:hypothetical protein